MAKPGHEQPRNTYLYSNRGHEHETMSQRAKNKTEVDFEKKENKFHMMAFQSLCDKNLRKSPLLMIVRRRATL